MNQYSLLDDPKDKRDVTILWSGGFDSTALVLKALREGIKFHTLSVILENNEQYQAYDSIFRTAQKSLIDLKLSKETGKWLTHSEYKVPVVEMKNHDYTQLPLWICHSVWQSTTERIWAGYVKGDYPWGATTLAINLMESLNGFIREGANKFQLEMPWEAHSKEEILDWYRAILPDVLQLVTTTEDGSTWLIGDDKKSVRMRKLMKHYRKVTCNKVEEKTENKTETIKDKEPTPSGFLYR